MQARPNAFGSKKQARNWGMERKEVLRKTRLPVFEIARRMDRREDDHCRKNQKLFSKTSARTVGH
jgi:hypothetical protein